MSRLNRILTPMVFRVFTNGSGDSDSEAPAVFAFKDSRRGLFIQVAGQFFQVTELLEHSASHLCEGVVLDLASDTFCGIASCLVNVLLKGGGSG